MNTNGGFANLSLPSSGFLRSKPFWKIISMAKPEGSLWKRRDCPCFSSYWTPNLDSLVRTERGVMVILGEGKFGRRVQRKAMGITECPPLCIPWFFFSTTLASGSSIFVFFKKLSTWSFTKVRGHDAKFCCHNIKMCGYDVKVCDWEFLGLNDEHDFAIVCCHSVKVCNAKNCDWKFSSLKG